MGEVRIRVYHPLYHEYGWAIHTFDHEKFLIQWDDGLQDERYYYVLEYSSVDESAEFLEDEVVIVREVNGL